MKEVKCPCPGQRSTGEIQTSEAVMVVKSSPRRRTSGDVSTWPASILGESFLPIRIDWLASIVVKGMAFGCL